jgi:2-dehydropantoate 2-reductase
MPTHPHIAVIGPGALGTLYAARLARAGVPVLLLDYRAERAAALAASGIRVHAAERFTAPVAVTADPRRLAEVDAAIVLVKAYHTEAVADTLAEYLAPRAIAVTLQNGLGNVETLMLHLGAARAFGGTTAQGARLEAPGLVHDTGGGPTTLGHLEGFTDDRLEAVAAALRAAGFAALVTDDLPAALWTKAILNAAINPVAALTRLRNGQLAEHAPSLTLMTAAAREAALVARKHGVRLGQQDWRARLQTICRATAGNVNSMLADVLNTRRTEIAAITGTIVRTAAQHRVSCPVNRTLLHLIETVEASYGTTVNL